MKKITAILLCCSLVVMTAAGCGANNKTKDTAASAETTKNNELKNKLDKEFTDFFGPDVFTGYVYVAKKGNVLLDKGYGKADFEKGTENTKQTKYEIASLTKQMTAFCVMQLQEKSLLNVNDTIDKYLPAFPHGNEITIHQLLTHTSGLPQYSEKFDITKFRPSYKGFGTEGKNEPVVLNNKPGTVFEYSNAGYTLLGYIIEKVSGKTLDIYFSENIFKPLDMKNTGFKNEKGEIENLATGYQSENKEKAEKSWTFLTIGPVLGASGVCSTIEDMIKWEKALTEKKVLSADSYSKIYTTEKSSYGYGWYIRTDSEGKRMFEHYGTASGYRTYILRGADEDILAIIASNNQNVPMEDMVDLLKEYLK